MATRTTEKTVTFTRPFALKGLDQTLPAGTYTVETDEEKLEGASFAAYRRTLTLLRRQPEAGRGGLVETFTVDPAELDEALEHDRASPRRPAGADRTSAAFQIRRNSDAGGTLDIVNTGLAALAGALLRNTGPAASGEPARGGDPPAGSRREVPRPSRRTTEHP